MIEMTIDLLTFLGVYAMLVLIITGKIEIRVVSAPSYKYRGGRK